MVKPAKTINDNLQVGHLFGDIKNLIDQAKNQVQQTANSTLVLLNWHIGNMINQHIIKNPRAEYGEKIIENLALNLEKQGYKYTKRSLNRARRFSMLYPNIQIGTALPSQLSWSHFTELIGIDDALKRNFYAELCAHERWDTRTLRAKISGLLFERTAIAKQPEKLIIQELENIQSNTPTLNTIFKDPYILDFLNLSPSFSETDLEQAIVTEFQAFIQELGNDFCFVARQKRMSTDASDRYLDLLFFHRGMRRLIAIELKLDKFQPEHKGQMEWYLRWLDKYEKKPGEDKPLGLILCASKDDQDIELLELDKTGIHVAEYLTALPPRKLLEDKLRRAINAAKEKVIAKNHE
ncbi:MAG: PDDEXK nuclease domain-containing protein [Gammaproteobacteria bacterium]|nr:PDDEXK nuclease domain-containing protein [Gammaproteobacteria bacterium]